MDNVTTITCSNNLEDKVALLTKLMNRCKFTGRFLSVKFTKADGSDRSMVVKKSLKLISELKSYRSEATEKMLATKKANFIETVAEITPNGAFWKSVNLKTVSYVRFDGVIYTFA